MPIVPPGGFTAFAQMTPASKAAWFRPGRTSNGRRRSKAKRAPRTSARKAKRSGGGRKMKFGSPAWQKKYRVGKFAKKR